MATESYRIIHEDEKRHKCFKCGAVRYEGFMRRVSRIESTACSQFGNDLKQWKCRRNCH